MKKIVLFFMVVIISASIFAMDFDAGQTVPIFITVPNPSTDTLLQGTPVDPESIFITIYDSSSTQVRRDRTAMTKWNDKTGEFVFNFVLPNDSTAIYVARIEIGYTGWDSLYVVRKLINVVDFFDVGADLSYGESEIMSKLDDYPTAESTMSWLNQIGGQRGAIIGCDSVVQWQYPLETDAATDSIQIYCKASDTDSTLYGTLHYVEGTNNRVDRVIFVYHYTP